MIDLVDVPLFRGLDPSAAQAVAAVFEYNKVPAGEVLFRQGEDGRSLVVVLDGLFELVQDDSGEDVHLADVGPGRVLGMVSLIDPGPRTATMRALEDATVAQLGLETFKKLWDAQGDAAAALHHQLALAAVHELRSAQRKLIELLDLPLADRLQPELGPLAAFIQSRAYQAGFFR
ncbi:MAG: cyclic nucleotide-binding domain-containing protein [Alphaproteobacteria bacterium]|nr:cyclic nucleotide-binding domain-containing protein [Alphaproteobacteria bacterium]